MLTKEERDAIRARCESGRESPDTDAAIKETLALLDLLDELEEEYTVYKDTGLSPEQIEDLVIWWPVCQGCDGKDINGCTTGSCEYEELSSKCMDRAIECGKELKAYRASGLTPERCAELAKAEANRNYWKSCAKLDGEANG